MTDMMINKFIEDLELAGRSMRQSFPGIWNIQPYREENVAVKKNLSTFSIQGQGEYSSKKFNIHAAKDEQITVYMDYTPENKLLLCTMSLTLEEGAHVRLIQLSSTVRRISLVYNTIQGSW